MLTIKTILKEVPGKGIGLFTDEYLKAGQVWWVWDNDLDKIIDPEQYAQLGEIQKSFVKKYGVKSDKDAYWLYTDHAKFCNHSDQPNSVGIEPVSGVDTKIKTTNAIKKGKELTIDYRKFIFDFPEGILNFEVV